MQIVGKWLPFYQLLKPLANRPNQNLNTLMYFLVPRTWFVHADGHGVIQVQRDRFLHNWRKIRPYDEYPRYHHVIGMFRAHLSSFAEFLEAHHLGVITPLQYELTYINHIIQGEGWNIIRDVGKIFPNFPWHTSKNDFLPPPEAVNWQTSFALPIAQGVCIPRFKVQRDVRMGIQCSCLSSQCVV